MNPVRGVLFVLALFSMSSASACTSVFPCGEDAETIVYSIPDWQVVVTVTGEKLSITNETPLPIYHKIFPEYILQLLEWGPCMEPNECPGARIDPRETRLFTRSSLTDRNEREFTVYWWYIDDPATGERIWPLQMGSTKVSFPSGLGCD